MTSDHYRRSPHIQGSMKKPCKVTATILVTSLKLFLQERYQKFIEDNYTESKYQEILNSHLHPQEERKEAPTAAGKRPQKRKTHPKMKTVDSKDIQRFLYNSSYRH